MEYLNESVDIYTEYANIVEQKLLEVFVITNVILLWYQK